MDKEKIKRINELTAIARQRELTEDEKKEREALRNEYRNAFKANLQAQLENVYVLDEKGNKKLLGK
jgi:uncharacterized protein YnzC (UPF0291/DUF896 family)